MKETNQKKREAERIARGLCRRGCGRPIAEGSRSRCQECLDLARRSTTEKSRRRESAGLCLKCGRRAATQRTTNTGKKLLHCEACLGRAKKKRDGKRSALHPLPPTPANPGDGRGWVEKANQ